MTTQIRLATPSDATQIQAIYAPIVENTFISFEQVVPSVDDIAGRIAKTLQQYPWLVCESDRHIAGYAYASSFRSRVAYQWTTEVTAYCHPEYHRRGIGRALYTALLALLSQQDYCSAIAGIALPNPASEGFHSAMGFNQVGMYKAVGYKLGAWHDMSWWQLALSPMQANPQPPIPIQNLVHSDEFLYALQAGEALVR